MNCREEAPAPMSVMPLWVEEEHGQALAITVGAHANKILIH